MNWKQALTQSARMFLRNGILTGITSSLTIVLTGLDTQTGIIHINTALVIVVFAATLLGSLIMAINTFLQKWDQVDTQGLLPIVSSTK